MKTILLCIEVYLKLLFIKTIFVQLRLKKNFMSMCSLVIMTTVLFYMEVMLNIFNLRLASAVMEDDQNTVVDMLSLCVAPTVHDVYLKTKPSKSL